MKRIISAVLSLGLAVCLIGCGSDDGGSTKQGANRDKSGGKSVGRAGKEDPKVASFIQSKGWTLMQDFRISDGKPLKYLNVQKKGAPFTDIQLTLDDCKMIAQAKTVQVLDLRRVKNLDDEKIKALAKNSNLEGILISSEIVTNEGILALASMKSLDHVSLFSTKKVTDAGISALSNLPKLEQLYLAFLTIDGTCFKDFADSQTLRSLTVEYADNLSDEGAQHIANLPNLEVLKLQTGFGKGKLTTAGIQAIVNKRLPSTFEFDKKLIDDDLFKLLVDKGWLYGPSPAGSKKEKPATAAEVKSISLDGTKVTDKGFEAVLDCTNTEYLFLSKTGISDVTFKKLGDFRKLKYLSLGGTKVTTEGLNAVASAPIDHLALEGNTLTEDTFKAIGRMKGLEELWLRGAKMKSEWLKHIATLPKLKELNLMGAAFEDSAAQYLKTMPALQRLTLNNTNLGDKGFEEIIKIPTLKSLNLDSTKVTKDAYLKAKKSHPKLRLYNYRHNRK